MYLILFYKIKLLYNRVHHKFTDTDADPHNSKRGLFFSHVGWLLVKKHPDVKRKGSTIDMSDLDQDPIVMFQKKCAFSLHLSCKLSWFWTCFHSTDITCIWCQHSASYCLRWCQCIFSMKVCGTHGLLRVHSDMCSHSMQHGLVIN